MVYTQKKNKNLIKFEFQEEGIDYSLKDEQVNKSVFIPFERITNNSHEVYESNQTFKNNAIYTGIVGTIFIAINIFYGARLWAWLFLLACPTFYILYKRSKVTFKVISVDREMDIFLIDDKQGKGIYSKLFEERNAYLKKNYGMINFDNDRQNEIEKFAWLKEMGIYSEREFEVIVDSIKSE